MAEDILDESMAKLPLLAADKVAAEVKRGEVFCSKIIHQRASHQSRFTWSDTFKKIMAHSHPDCTGPNAKGEYPRPISSPFPCWQCHRYFDGPPVMIAIIALNGTRSEWGNFCDITCGNTYLHANMNDHNLASRIADYHEYCQDVHGFTGDVIGFAPHFSMREAYGGPLTEEQFDKIARTPGLRTMERRAPFLPTDAVIEWQCKVNLSADAKRASAEATAPASNPFSRPRQAAPLAAAPAAPLFAENEGKTADEVLTGLMGYKADATYYHHQWEVRGLKQPPKDDIQKRLLSLPEPEQKQGSYELYWKRKGCGAPLPAQDMQAAAVVASAEASKQPVKAAAVADRGQKRKSGSKSSDATSESALGLHLVPAKRQTK
jgi:hypothetical protein